MIVTCDFDGKTDVKIVDIDANGSDGYVYYVHNNKLFVKKIQVGRPDGSAAEIATNVDSVA